MKDNFKIDKFLRDSLKEDLGILGDITSLSTIPENAIAEARIIAKQKGIVAGNWVAESVFLLVESNLKYHTLCKDGASVSPGDIIARISGPVRGILAAERTALNFLGRLSGIATLTQAFVTQVQGTKARILDTRKTTPGLRVLEKYAVKVGGGHNHRFGLFDMVLIKDNHIASARGIENAVTRCRQYLKQHSLTVKIEVETRTLEEVQTTLSLNVDRILLDNMTVEQVRQAVALVQGKTELEASGGITLENVRNYAETGVDFISVGALTHSAPALDVSLLID